MNKYVYIIYTYISVYIYISIYMYIYVIYMYIYRNIYNTYMIFMAVFSVWDIEFVSHGIRPHNLQIYIFQYFSNLAIGSDLRLIKDLRLIFTSKLGLILSRWASLSSTGGTSYLLSNPTFTNLLSFKLNPISDYGKLSGDTFVRRIIIPF